MSDSGTAGTSIAETIAALDALPPETVEKRAPEPQATEHENTEAVPTADDAGEPERAIEGETVDDEGDTEAGPAVQTPLTPPQFWDDEDKSAFVTLTRAEQERLLKYSKVSDKATAARIEAASIAQKAATAEASKFSQYVTGLDKLASQVQEAFKSKWPDDIDWNRVVDERGAPEAFKLKNQYDEDKKLSEKLQTAKAEAEQVELQRFRNERSSQFKEVVPDLADPKLGPTRQLELVRYLAEHAGVHPDVIVNRASAKELSIGYKAMLWDKAQSTAASLAKQPKPAAEPSKTSVRASAPVSRGSQETARTKSLEGRFNQNPSRENLIALLEAKG